MGLENEGSQCYQANKQQQVAPVSTNACASNTLELALQQIATLQLQVEALTRRVSELERNSSVPNRDNIPLVAPAISIRPPKRPLQYNETPEFSVLALLQPLTDLDITSKDRLHNIALITVEDLTANLHKLVFDFYNSNNSTSLNAQDRQALVKDLSTMIIADEDSMYMICFLKLV